ncbi:hypothetical protein HispidOSU_018112, partial [Sigmodon hispidus]
RKKVSETFGHEYNKSDETRNLHQLFEKTKSDIHQFIHYILSIRVPPQNK